MMSDAGRPLWSMKGRKGVAGRSDLGQTRAEGPLRALDSLLQPIPTTKQGMLSWKLSHITEN